MQTSYENVIEEIVQSIFSTMLNIELFRDEAPPPADQELLLTAIQIAGEWMGSVVLALSPELACEAASSMLEIPVATVNQVDLGEVAAELVNMVGGNLKSLLPGPSYLSLPTIIAGSDFGMQVHQAIKIEDVTLRSAAGSLRVRLYTKILDSNIEQG
jgi:chemotaxis protein CheX